MSNTKQQANGLARSEEPHRRKDDRVHPSIRAGGPLGFEKARSCRLRDDPVDCRRMPRGTDYGVPGGQAGWF